jgi:hypothetical protein
MIAEITSDPKLPTRFEKNKNTGPIEVLHTQHWKWRFKWTPRDSFRAERHGAACAALVTGKEKAPSTAGKLDGASRVTVETIHLSEIAPRRRAMLVWRA